MRDDGGHGACVAKWLEDNDRGLSSHEALRLFELGIDALWARTKVTLGEITLATIMDRVLHRATTQFPFLAALKVEPVRGVSCDALRDELVKIDPAELRSATRFVLVEFLVVLGNLTAEILTPALQSELLRVVLPHAAEPMPRAAESHFAEWEATPEGKN